MKKKSIFQHKYRFDPLVGKETCDERSMTVPGLALSISEIMQRSAAGMPVPPMHGLEYGNDEDFDDAGEVGADIIDAYDTSARIEALKEQISAAKAKEQQKLKQQEPKQEPNQEPKPAEPTDTLSPKDE